MEGRNFVEHFTREEYISTLLGTDFDKAEYDGAKRRVDLLTKRAREKYRKDAWVDGLAADLAKDTALPIRYRQRALLAMVELPGSSYGVDDVIRSLTPEDQLIIIPFALKNSIRTAHELRRRIWYLYPELEKNPPLLSVMLKGMSDWDLKEGLERKPKGVWLSDPTLVKLMEYWAENSINSEYDIRGMSEELSALVDIAGQESPSKSVEATRILEKVKTAINRFPTAKKRELLNLIGLN